MLKYLTLTITAVLVFTNVTIAESSDLFYRTCIPQTTFNDMQTQNLTRRLEGVKLFYKIKSLKEKYHLEYESEADLLETCHVIVDQETVSPNFNRYDIAAIVIKESRFYRKALNKKDGGKGLTQAMPRYWKEELPWYHHPYDKVQAIRACYTILDLLKGKYKTKALALKRYNGSTHKSTLYARDVQRIKQEIAIA